MVITIASWKGGVGKSTTAIHLARYFEDKAPTLVADTDPNRTAMRWAAANTSRQFKVITEAQIAKEAPHFTHVIIDTPARPENLDLKGLVEGSDIVIIPCTPSMYAVATLVDAEATIQGLGPSNVRVLLTDVPTGNQRDGEIAREALTGFGYKLFKRAVRHTKAFKHAEMHSCFVSEVRSLDAAYDAWLDYAHVGAEIEEIINGTSPTTDGEQRATPASTAASAGER